MTISTSVSVFVAAAVVAVTGIGYAVHSAGAGTATRQTELLTPDGFGVLKIGMTRAEVDAAIGPSPFVDEPGADECEFYTPVGAPDDLLVMLEGDALTRITVSGDVAARTADGVVIGDAMQPLKARYARTASWAPHVYAEAPAGYLTLWADGVRRDDGFYDGEGARGLVLEADSSGKVAYIHVGTPSIQYVEGCS